MGGVEEPSKRLLMRSESVQKRDAVGTDDVDSGSGKPRGYGMRFNRAHQDKRQLEDEVNESNTAPSAVPKSDSDSDKEAKLQADDGFYYKAKHAEVDEDACSVKQCFSHKELTDAVKETLEECVASKVFGVGVDDGDTKEKECSVPIIMVGPTTKYYSPLLVKDLASCTPDGITVDVIAEEVKNQEDAPLEERSSALKALLQSAPSPHELARFKSIDAIKREIVRIDHDESAQDEEAVMPVTYTYM